MVNVKDEIKLEDRYNKLYKISRNNQIWLEDFLPTDQESKFLLLKVVEQAVRDYVTLYKFSDEKSVEAWQSAVDFLFNEEYVIDWGDITFTLNEILDLLDIDIDWFKSKTKRKFNLQYGKK